MEEQRKQPESALSWESYPKIFNLGHPALTNLFNGPVIIEEKLDGSQFSFCNTGESLLVRSRGRVFFPGAADAMFEKAVKSVLDRLDLLMPGWTYRGEYFKSPNHNTLKYSRIPEGHIAIFDIGTGPSTFLPEEEKRKEAERIGLECVPLIYCGEVTEGIRWFNELINFESFLGGVKAEGVVIKNYSQFAPDKKVLMGKHVSESFKESHKSEWRKNNPTGSDFITTLAQSYVTEARWHKAVQHVREDGNLTKSPADIANLINELKADFRAECADEVKNALWRWATPQIERALTRGFPEWYKQQLLNLQFDGEDRECSD